MAPQELTSINISADLTFNIHFTPFSPADSLDETKSSPIFPPNSTTPFVGRNFLVPTKKLQSNLTTILAMLTTLSVKSPSTDFNPTFPASNPDAYDPRKFNPYARREISKMKNWNNMERWYKKFNPAKNRSYFKDLNCSTPVSYDNFPQTEVTEVMSRVDTALVFGLSLSLVPIIVVLFCGVNSVFKTIKTRAKKMKRKTLPVL